LCGTTECSEPRPLSGQTVAVTRVPAQAAALSELLRAAGAEVIEAPTIELAPLDDYEAVDRALRAISRYAWIVLTSTNGADALLARLKAVGGDSRSHAGVRVAAVGSATAARLAGHGIHSDLVPGEAVGEALAEALIQQGVSGKRILLLRADRARDRLPRALRQAGATCDDLAAYRTVCPEALSALFLERLDAGRIDWITLTSPSSFVNLLSLLGESRAQALRTVKLASIGPVTTRAIRAAGFVERVEADPHDVPEIVAAMVAGMRHESRGPGPAR